MDDRQAGLPQGGLLERERERVGAGVQVANANTHVLLRGQRGIANDDDWTGRVAGDVPADRAEDQRGKRARAAGAYNEHERA